MSPIVKNEAVKPESWYHNHYICDGEKPLRSIEPEFEYILTLEVFLCVTSHTQKLICLL